MHMRYACTLRSTMVVLIPNMILTLTEQISEMHLINSVVLTTRPYLPLCMRTFRAIYFMEIVIFFCCSLARVCCVRSVPFSVCHMCTEHTNMLSIRGKFAYLFRCDGSHEKIFAENAEKFSFSL